MFTPTVEKIKFTKEDDLSEFYYEENVLFDRPLVVRGTRKQFIPYPTINKMQELTEENFNTVLTTLQKQEDFDMVYIESVSKLEIVAIEELGFYFQIKEELTDRTNVINLFIPFNESSVAFRRFSHILKIPYTFSKKNPGSLNQENFLVWKNKICEEKKKSIPICFVYSKSNTQTFRYAEQDIIANVVMTLFSVSTVKKADGSTSLIKKNIEDQIPILHKILPTMVSILKTELSAKIILHSIATGFNGSNKGDHYLKFLVESPEMKWNINGDEYLPTISVRSNFTGDDKKGLGQLFISLSLMKLTCANGAMVAIPEEYLQNIRENFVNKLLEINKIEPNNPHYTKYVLKYNKQFKKKFADFGCSITLHDAMHNFAKSEFLSLLKIFLSCKDTLITETLQELQIPFGEKIRDEDFVEVIETLSKKNKFKQNMSKAVILEYLSAKQEGLTIFPNSYSIVNYLTYIAQAYNSKIQSEVERKVIGFGKEITAALVHKAQYRQEILKKYQKFLIQ